MIVVTIFEPNGISIWFKNCHHDHIPFTAKGNGDIVFSVYTQFSDRQPLYMCTIRKYVLYMYCPDGIASTAWEYASLLCNIYRDAGAKCCHHPETSHAQSPLISFYIQYNMLLTGLHHSSIVSIPLPLPSKPFIAVQETSIMRAYFQALFIHAFFISSYTLRIEI